MPTDPNNGGAGFKPAMAPVGPDLASVPFLPALAEGAPVLSAVRDLLPALNLPPS